MNIITKYQTLLGFDHDSDEQKLLFVGDLTINLPQNLTMRYPFSLIERVCHDSRRIYLSTILSLQTRNRDIKRRI